VPARALERFCCHERQLRDWACFSHDSSAVSLATRHRSRAQRVQLASAAIEAREPDEEKTMKDQRARTQFTLFAVLSMLAASLSNCNSDNSSPSLGMLGDAGTAQGGDSTASPVLICGAVPEKSVCDPVTAAPCNILAGQTCDYSIIAGRFQCFPPPNRVPPGGTCDTVANFCSATATCNVKSHRCQHYCCDDADCLVGPCQFPYRKDGAASIGSCFEEFPSCGGDGSAGCAGAAGDGNGASGASGAGTLQ